MSIYMGNETGNMALLIAVRIHDPAAKLDHVKREIVGARFYEISAEAVKNAASQEMG